MWTTIIIIILGYYIFYQVDKRVRMLEEAKRHKNSHRFSVDVSNAVMKHKKFGELTGIKSASEGKEYKDWSKTDKQKLNHISQNINNNSSVSLTYLASENAYFIRTGEGGSYIAFRDSINNLLYSAIVAGDKDGWKSNIEFLLYERFIKKDHGKYEWILVPCLKYKGDNSFKKEDRTFDTLFEFPHFKERRTDEELKQLGFEIDRWGGDDVFTDDFGEMDTIPTVLKYIKNGAEIRYVA